MLCCAFTDADSNVKYIKMKKQELKYKKGDDVAGKGIIKSGPFNGYYNLIESGTGKIITLSEKEINELIEKESTK